MKMVTEVAHSQDSKRVFANDSDLISKLKLVESHECSINYGYEVTLRMATETGDKPAIAILVSHKDGNLNVRSTAVDKNGNSSTNVYNRSGDIQFVLHSKKKIPELRDGSILRHFQQDEKLDSLLNTEKKQLSSLYPAIMPLTSCAILGSTGTLSDYLQSQGGIKIRSQEYKADNLIVAGALGNHSTIEIHFYSFDVPIAHKIIVTVTTGPYAGKNRWEVVRDVSKNDGFHTCQHILSTFYSTPQPEAQRKRDFTFSSYNRESISDEVFDMSYYGIPDPVSAEASRGSTVYIWILSIALVLALVALVCRWLLRRRTPVAPSPAA